MKQPPLTVGETILTPARTIGESDINLFAGLIGDFTPVHIDEEFARTTPMGTRIAHGTHTMANATGLLTQTGVLGERVIGLLNINWNFSAPVKIGDTIKAKVKVAEIRPTSKPGRSLATFKFDVVNQRDESVQAGEMLVLIKDD